VRTTLSLDDDVANLLKKEMRRSGSSLEETANDLLRRGLMASGVKTKKPFVVTPDALGLPPGLSYDNVEDLIKALEGRSRRSQHHRKARAWLEGVLSSAEAAGLPWQTVGAFLRIVTNRKLG
jgi:hypothetical protein